MRKSEIINSICMFLLLSFLYGCKEVNPVSDDHITSESALINRVYFHRKKDYVIYYKSIYSNKGIHYLGNCSDRWYDYKTGYEVGNSPRVEAMSSICMARNEAKEILPQEQLYIDFPDLPRGLGTRKERTDFRLLKEADGPPEDIHRTQPPTKSVTK